MVAKTLKFSETKVPRTQAGASYPPSSTVNSVIADAVWSRIRPKPLNATKMVITIINRDTEVHTGGYLTRTGDFIWCQPFVKFINFSDGGEGALNRALSKLSGSDGNLGIGIATGLQTVDMIKNRISDLHRLSRALKRGDFGAAASILGDSSQKREVGKVWTGSRNIASAYAELAWGWTPLVSDLGQHAKAAAREFSGGSRAVRRSSSGNSGQRIDSRDLATMSLDRLLQDHGQALKGSASVSGRVTNRHLRQIDDLGLLNPFTIVWDKIPYSFVFDWAIPFGTYLGGWTATAGLSDVIACRKSIKTQVIVGDNKSYPMNVGTVRRDITRNPTLAQPSFKGLARQGSLRWGQVVSIAALTRLLLH